MQWLENSDEVRGRRSSARTILPNDPVEVHGFRFQLRNCSFPVPGLYWMQFWYEGWGLAQQAFYGSDPWSAESMAGFWESCLASTYYSFAAGNPAGRADVEWWIRAALSRGFLQWNALDTLSLLLVIFASVPNSPLRSRAVGELQSRDLASSDLGASLVGFGLPDLGEPWRDAARTGKKVDLAQLLFDDLWSWFGWRLIRFLDRLYLVDMNIAWRSAWRYVRATYKREDFVCGLYRHVLAQIPVWVPPQMRQPPPTWWGMVLAEERFFLERSLRLSFQERVALFASVCSKLTTREIAGVYQAFHPAWNPVRVAGLLRKAWETIFR